VVISPAVSEAKRERRSQPRLAASLPVTIQAHQGKCRTTGYTRDFSTSGIFLYTETQLKVGSELELVLVMPPELSGGEQRWVCCRTSVVRVEDSEEGGDFGIAAVIRSIQALPEISG